MDIAEIRSSLGLTQAAFAERLGVSPGYVGDLERGHRKLSIKLAARLEKTCDQAGIVDAVIRQKAQDARQSAA